MYYNFQYLNRIVYLVRQLKHENLVKYLGYCKSNSSSSSGAVFHVCMELCYGSLVKFMKRRRAEGGGCLFELHEVSRLMRQVLTAVDYLHSQGAIHRYSW